MTRTTFLESSFRWIAAYSLVFCLIVSHVVLHQDVVHLQEQLPTVLKQFRQTIDKPVKNQIPIVQDKDKSMARTSLRAGNPLENLSRTGQGIDPKSDHKGPSSRTSPNLLLASNRRSPPPSSFHPSKTKKKKKNAYSFLVAGCDPDEVERCRFFLYAVYVSIHALQKMGSTADFHVFVELLYTSRHRTLGIEDERILLELGVVVHYIPPHPEQSFYRSQLHKFRILGLIQHQRIFYLDSDLLPLSNLDYLFDLIDDGVLRQNVAFVGKAEPANGGSFLLTPRLGALPEIHQLIWNKEHTPWNVTMGWGHEMIPPDRYVTSSLGERHLWDFFGSDGDQGLLYYWIKYVEKDASFIWNNGRIEHWGIGKEEEEADQQSKVVFLGSHKNAFQNLTLPESICFDGASWCAGQRRPRRDFFHFTGDRKPWLQPLPSDFSPSTYRLTIDHYWYSLLEEVNHKHRLQINLKTAFGRHSNSRTQPLKPAAAYDRRFVQKQGKQVYTTLIDDPASITMGVMSDSKTKAAVPPPPTKDSLSVHSVSARNAYAFLIGGCEPDRPAKYRYFLYSIYVIIEILKRSGSKADFHVLVEMFSESRHNTLPAEEERVLSELGAHIHYIPKHPQQSFYALQLQKFRILGWVQYRHVMYLDSDVIPLTNLDYLFDFMDRDILRKHVAFVGKSEPANGGTFVLSPSPGVLNAVNDLISKKEHSIWNYTIGWGQEIVPPDRYLTNYRGEQTTWRFHGSDTDQGLLYYWIKYAEKDASFILENGTVEHWGQDEHGAVKNLGSQPLSGLLPPRGVGACEKASWCVGIRPKADFVHLTGNGMYERKPWFKGLPSDYSEETKHSTIIHYWFSVLDDINQKHHLGIELRQHFATRVPWNATKLLGYNDAFKQRGVTTYTTIID